MFVANATFLDSIRVTRMIQDQATRYQNTLPLRFLDRLVQQNADDDEILINYTAKNYAADIIPDDQAAPVYDNLKLEFVTNAIPNIKYGEKFTQNLLNRLERIKSGMASTADANYFKNFQQVAVERAIRNIRERANMLSAAMYIDSLTYSRNGVVISGSWGMPSDLKATPGTLWTSTSATPITDILTMKLYAATTYGEVYDRLTLSTTDMINAFATTEFKSQIASLAQIASPLATSAFNTRDQRNMTFFSALLNMTVETDDKTYNEKAVDGTDTAARALPFGKVILDNSQDDKNPSAADFANAICTESTVAGFVGDPDNFPVGERYGPIAYYTGSNHNLNPPGMHLWAVQRGFPRRHRKTMSALLTVQ